MNLPSTILQDIVIYYVPKLHMAAINTLDCSVFRRYFGYRLAIGWPWPKINTLQDIGIYYNVPKLHMVAITTLDCSVLSRFFGYRLAIGWLLAAYGLKSIHFKRE